MQVQYPVNCSNSYLPSHRNKHAERATDHLVGSVARPRLDLPGRIIQLHITVRAVEVVGVVGVPPPPQGLPVYQRVALEAHVLVQALCLKTGIAVVTHGSAHVLDEA